MYAGIAKGINNNQEIILLNGNSYIEVNQAVDVPIRNVKNPTPKDKMIELKK
jgi:ethanolamine utilization microcompartment shell protein EutL|tara:strand:+ start:390 stop:545 length:156 start_codon:yes stop_codon:yes gene_type:complete